MAHNELRTDAYIALGANLGRRIENLQTATQRLASRNDCRCLARSGVYETAPVGGPPGQPNYLNAVICVCTSLSAHDLLHCCLSIENELGRRRSARNAPRVIDLDLLLYGDRIISTEMLELPHPRMHTRRFVLEPLAEIAPHVRHPILDATIEELLKALSVSIDAKTDPRILELDIPADLPSTVRVRAKSQ